MDCGEQALLSAIRQADPDTLVVADGFSCQTQIADAGTGHRALHTAQVMALARELGHTTADDLPAAGQGRRSPSPSAHWRGTGWRRVGCRVRPGTSGSGYREPGAHPQP
jgi:hypothetical protein